MFSVIITYQFSIHTLWYKIIYKPVISSTRSFRTEAKIFLYFYTADRSRTVSQRSKPSSRTALIGEQPNP